jgi:hypothetical protein
MITEQTDPSPGADPETDTAAVPTDFPFTVAFPNAANLIASDVITSGQAAAILQDATAAAGDWGQFIGGGQAPLRITVDVSAIGSVYLATGGSTSNVAIGTLDGRALMEPSAQYTLTTGTYLPGSTSDITITIGSAYLPQMYLNPDPAIPGTAPPDKYDLVGILRHEMAHGLGMVGFIAPGGSRGADETLFDHYVQQNPDGTASFVGPTADAVYGGPVPLTTASNGEQFYHLGNSGADPATQDLMSGLGLPPGAARPISALDLAIMKDIGEPVLSAGVTCFARGTRLAGPAGEIAVEELKAGDILLTVTGAHRRIVWIGHRQVDCTRHPDGRQVWPVRVKAGAFGPNLPKRDLLLSPQHAIFAEGVLIPVKALVNRRSIRQEACPRIEYFHVEMVRHELLLAEGLPTESYLDTGDRACFANGGGVLALHPDFSRWVWDGRACAELKVVGPEVDATRARLETRAGSRRRGAG